MALCSVYPASSTCKLPLIHLCLCAFRERSPSLCFLFLQIHICPICITGREMYCLSGTICYELISSLSLLLLCRLQCPLPRPFFSPPSISPSSSYPPHQCCADASRPAACLHFTRQQEQMLADKPAADFTVIAPRHGIKSDTHMVACRHPEHTRTHWLNFPTLCLRCCGFFSAVSQNNNPAAALSFRQSQKTH